MKDLYFEATEGAWDVGGSEPTDADIEARYQARLDRLYDAADRARDAEKERGV